MSLSSCSIFRVSAVLCVAIVVEVSYFAWSNRRVNGLFNFVLSIAGWVQGKSSRATVPVTCYHCNIQCECDDVTHGASCAEMGVRRPLKVLLGVERAHNKTCAVRCHLSQMLAAD